jgi:hypothetical protein
VNENKNITILRAAFYSIFKNKDPFERMFNEHIGHKVLLCRTNGFYLTKKQFEALIKTVKKIGESSFFLSEIEGDCFLEESNQQSFQLKHWNMNIETSYEDYKKNPLVLENAIYSSSGTWGVVVSHEDFAILGAKEDFISIFKKFYPEWSDGIQNFLKMCAYHKEVYKSDLSWVQEFLNHIQE